MKSVLVLISTYNGSAYLEQQIESLCAQTDVDVRILVRDDGSSDATHNILNEYQSKGVLSWYTGDNLRPARSFWNLIQNASDSDFYALCDQDDYWKPDKLKIASDMLSRYNDVPALYFSQTTLTDADLNPIRTPLIHPTCEIGEALIAHYATGCTFVFNKRLMGKLREYTPEYLSMHDNWIYRVCLAVGGSIIFDPESHIFYRQHGNNVIGLQHSFMSNIKLRWTRIFNRERERSKMAKELIKGYANYMSKDTFDLVSLAATSTDSLCSRIKLVLRKEVSSPSVKCNITSRIAILLAMY